jgi:uncharacterized protein (UPF0276 family)
LYEEAIARIGTIPTLLEWDTHIPPLAEVLDEADRVDEAYARGLSRHRDVTAGKSSTGVIHAFS